MTTVINLYGGPGTGKSTRAASLYAEMKTAGINCELIREYVKDWAWEGKHIGKYDQTYILAKQFKKESLLYNKVDYIITDSPFILSGFYAEHYRDQKFITETALNLIKLAQEDGVLFRHYALKRFKKYNHDGRYESEEQAKAIDGLMVNFLEKNNIQPCFIDCEDSKKNEAILSTLIPFHSVTKEDHV